MTGSSSPISSPSTIPCNSPWYLPRGHHQSFKIRIKQRTRRHQRGCLEWLIGALVLPVLTGWLI